MAGELETGQESLESTLGGAKGSVREWLQKKGGCQSDWGPSKIREEWFILLKLLLPGLKEILVRFSLAVMDHPSRRGDASPRACMKLEEAVSGRSHHPKVEERDLASPPLLRWGESWMPYWDGVIGQVPPTEGVISRR